MQLIFGISVVSKTGLIQLCHPVLGAAATVALAAAALEFFNPAGALITS